MEIDFVRSRGNGFEWIKPYRDISSIEEWKHWLASNLTYFDSKEVHNAAILIVSYMNGLNYVFSQLKKRGLNGIQLPQIGIVTSGKFPATAASDSKNKIVLLNKSSLWFSSLCNVEEIFINKTPRDETTFIGSRVDMYGLIGVEEGYHNVFSQIKGELDGEEVPPFKIPLKNYDAKEDEYRALKWQLKYAKAKKMPQVTISTLQQRLDSANTIRGII